MMGISVNGLACVSKQIALFFESGLGYTTAAVNNITIDLDSDTVSVSIYSRDDFQADLSYDSQFHHPFSYVKGGTIDELWDAARRHPNRKTREITVVLRGTEGLRKSAEDISNLVLKEELARVFTRMDDLKSTLLPAPTEPPSPLPLGDDEIPF